VRGEQERLWLAIDAARKQLSQDKVDPAVNALWAAVGSARLNPPAALAIVLLAVANFSRDALMSLESGSAITDPGRDDRVKAVPQYFTQLLEAAINDARAKKMLARTTQVEGHA